MIRDVYNDKHRRVIESIHATMSALRVLREKAIMYELDHEQSRCSFRLAALQTTLDNFQYE